MVNPDSHDIDGLPLLSALQKTVDTNWSGILRVNKGGDHVGSVFLNSGNVAWAVSKNQTENFSTFLERIGLIPKEKLNEVVKRYKALGKARKLGELLEEEGLISHDRLKECLGAHIRAALHSLMDDPEVVIEASHGEMIVDANLMFELKDLLTENNRVDVIDVIENVVSSTDDSNGDENHGSLNEILETLAPLPGYRFSFVSGIDGKLLALHKSDEESGPEAAVTSATEWINSSAKNCSKWVMGKMECLILEHEKGLLVAQSADDERDCFITVAFGKEGKLGVIKHKIAELILPIRQSMT